MDQFVLAQLQLRWGNENLQSFNEAFGRLTSLFEDQGVCLRNSLLTQFGGQLYEVWNLWEVESATHMDQARAALRSIDEYHVIHAELTKVIVSEQLRYLRSIKGS